MSFATMNISPFATALPAPHVFTAYDADGDAIMTDADTGLPIIYGVKRSRSASLDTDTSDSRPSKHSRSSSMDDGVGDGATLASVMPQDGAVPAPKSRPCPHAPMKAPVGPSRHDDDDDSDGDGHESALRNLAERMADVALEGEPRSPPGGEPDAWCSSVTVSDLGLRLDMRHPRVVLNFLRFIYTYNEIAPDGEEIHLPPLYQSNIDYILSHPSIVNPAPEFASQIAELHAYLNYFVSYDGGGDEHSPFYEDSE